MAKEKPKSRPGVGVAVIVANPKHENCVLLGRRLGATGAGLLQLPGGHLEFGETWEETAHREVLEEAGLHIKDVKFCAAVNSVRLDISYHFVTIFMKAEVAQAEQNWEPRNMEPDKCEGWNWVEWQDISQRGDELFYALKDFVALGIDPFK